VSAIIISEFDVICPPHPMKAVTSSQRKMSSLLAHVASFLLQTQMIGKETPFAFKSDQ
jgi:hypothetical protein